jgi:hypothetical protein
LVRNAKNKIKREKKKYGLDRSKEIDIPSLNTIKTRSEFNKLKQNLKKFNVRDRYVTNEKGVTLTEREIYHAKKLTREAQYIAKKEKKKRDRLVNKDKNEMKKLKEPSYSNAPMDFDINSVTSRGYLSKKFERLEHQADPERFKEQSKTMRDNFIQKLKEEFNSDADDLIKKLENMNPDTFYALYEHANGTGRSDFFHFDIFYKPTGIVSSEQDPLPRLNRYIKRYEQGKFDNDLNLKDF